MNIPTATKAFLFDMDGILVNTEDIAHDLFIEFAKEFNSKFTEDDHKHILGTTETFWTEYLCNKWSTSISPKEFANVFWSRRNMVLDSRLRLMSGVMKLLQNLKEKGYKIALVTSTPHEYVKIVLDRFEIFPYFNIIVAGDEISNGKPNPEPYIKAIRELGLSSSDCVVVEDALDGVKSGKSAGCFVIAVPTIHAKGLNYSEANVVVESLDEIELCV